MVNKEEEADVRGDRHRLYIHVWCCKLRPDQFRLARERSVDLSGCQLVSPVTVIYAIRASVHKAVPRATLRTGRVPPNRDAGTEGVGLLIPFTPSPLTGPHGYRSRLEGNESCPLWNPIYIGVNSGPSFLRKTFIFQSILLQMHDNAKEE